MITLFGNNLKACREELGMTQKELGFVFGLSDSTIRSWENAHESIPLLKLIKFCNLYNYSLDYVVGLTRKNIDYPKFKTSKSIIGKRLKEFRKSRHLSQQVLADNCKISQTTYSGYETGHYLINTINLYYICKTYNISMDYMVGRINNPKLNIN